MTERWPVYEGGRLTPQSKPDVPASRYTVDNPIASGGGGPHDPGMEALMSAMEQRLDKVENRLEKIDDRLRGVEIRLGEVAGTLNVLVGKIPSWWQQPVGTAGLLAVILAAIGLMAHFRILAVGSP